MRYRTIAYCVDEGCKCEHRFGVTLYDGYDQAEAEDAKRLTPTGYEVNVESLGVENVA